MTFNIQRWRNVAKGFESWLPFKTQPKGRSEIWKALIRIVKKNFEEMFYLSLQAPSWLEKLFRGGILPRLCFEHKFLIFRVSFWQDKTSMNWGGFEDDMRRLRCRLIFVDNKNLLNESRTVKTAGWTRKKVDEMPKKQTELCFTSIKQAINKKFLLQPFYRRQ